MSTISTAETMTLDGGNPSLDLVNSGYDLRPGVPVERLNCYDDLLILSERLGIIDRQTAQTLQQEAQKNPKLAARALAEIKVVRKVLYDLFATQADKLNKVIDYQALETFNRYVGQTLGYRKISLKDEKFIPDWVTVEKDLDTPLRRYILAAYHLITGPQQIFIKQCCGCAWLFLDESKNHRRKWCDMQTCGSSEKARRYYQKQKQIRQQ